MKKLALFLVVVLLTGLCLSGCGNPHEEMIEEAIEELEDYWANVYDEQEDYDMETDRYFKIVNTRVITLDKNDYELLEDIEYIVDFVVYTDYFGSGYYVTYTGPGTSVVVYRDGAMKATYDRIMRVCQNHYDYGIAEEVIKSIDDYGDAYNCEKTLD